jgi:hypothetical protein
MLRTSILKAVRWVGDELDAREPFVAVRRAFTASRMDFKGSLVHRERCAMPLDDLAYRQCAAISAGTRSTEHEARWATRSLTLPRALIPPTPRRPITTSEA